MEYRNISLFYGNYITSDYYKNKSFYKMFYNYSYDGYSKNQTLTPKFKDLEIRQINESLKFYVNMDGQEFVISKEADKYNKEKVRHDLELLEETDIFKMLEILTYGKPYKEYLKEKAEKEDEDYWEYYYNTFVLGGE